MKLTTLLTGWLTDLKTWLATTHNCECVIAPGPATAVHLVVSAAPNKAMCVLSLDGDANESDNDDDDVIAAKFSVWVKYAPGLLPDPGSHLVVDQPGSRPSLIGLCEAVRTRILEKRFTADDIGSQATYAGMGEIIIQADGIPIPLEAFRMRFEHLYSPDAITPRS